MRRPTTPAVLALAVALLLAAGCSQKSSSDKMDEVGSKIVNAADTDSPRPAD